MTQLLGTPIYGKRATGESVNTATWTPTFPPLYGVHVGPVLVGALVTNTQPIDEPEIVKQATLFAGLLNTFYNRVLIEPSRLDLGNLLSVQTRQISVWNGFLSSKTMASVQRINDPGIQFDQPVTTPYIMLPLQQLFYTLAATTDGPAVINAQYVWDIDGVEYRVEVVGRRVVLFPYGPNWSAPVTESLEWMTDVIRSYDGREQRRSLRTKARRGLSYRLSVSRQESARLENLLWGWQNRTFAVPVWTDKPRLTTNQLQGDTFLPLPTSAYSFTPNGLAAIYFDDTDYEVLEVDAVAPNGITLKRPIERNWSKGTIVYPCLLGQLPNAVSTTRLTSNTFAAAVSFDFSPVTTDPFTPEGGADVSYDGREVITKQPNWIRPLDNTFDYRFDTLDRRTGAIEWDTTEDFPRIRRQYSWLLKNRDEIRKFRSMLGRLQGQRNSLYVPTWHDDFMCNEPVGASDVAINVVNNGFRQLVGIDPARDRIMIRLKNGQIFYRQLIGLSMTTSGTLLTMNSALGVSVTPNDIHTIHLLVRSRLETDRIEISWRSNEVAVVETTFTSVLE